MCTDYKYCSIRTMGRTSYEYDVKVARDKTGWLRPSEIMIKGKWVSFTQLQKQRKSLRSFTTLDYRHELGY